VGTLVYRRDLGQLPQSITLHSFFDEFNGVCRASTFTTTVSPTIFVGDLAPLFTSLFEVRH